MKTRTQRYVMIGTILSLVIYLVLFGVIIEARFPTFEYTGILERKLIPLKPYNGIAAEETRFLWDHRSLDLTSQAFVIVGAVVCCLAMLKTGGES